MSTPYIEPAGPRQDRADYISGGYFASAPGHFQWEYTDQQLAYKFDQPVQGVGLDTHTLTKLYAQRERSTAAAYGATNLLGLHERLEGHHRHVNR